MSAPVKEVEPTIIAKSDRSCTELRNCSTSCPQGRGAGCQGSGGVAPCLRPLTRATGGWARWWDPWHHHGGEEAHRRTWLYSKRKAMKIEMLSEAITSQWLRG